MKYLHQQVWWTVWNHHLHEKRRKQGEERRKQGEGRRKQGEERRRWRVGR